MAAIREVLTLVDQFSQTFSSYLKMGQQAAASAKTASAANADFNDRMAELGNAATEAGKALTDLGDKLKDAGDSSNKAAKEQEQANRKMQEGAKAADSLTNKLKGLVTTYLSFQGIKKALDWVGGNLELSDTQRNAENQLRAVLSNTGTDVASSFGAVTGKASEIQGRGIYGDEAMIAAAAEFSTYFKDVDAVMSMMDTLADYTMGMTGGGAVDKTAMVDYATNLGKIMSGSYDAMSKKGFEFSDVQKAIIEGTATQAQIVEALGEEYLDCSADMQAAAAINQVIAESWGGLYETMSNTPEGKIIQLQNRMGDLREELGDRLYPAVLQVVDVFNDNFPQIEQILTALSDACAQVVVVIGWIAQAAIMAGGWIVENSDLVIAVLIGIGVAAGVAGAQMAKSAATSAIAWAKANWPLILIAASVALVIYMARKAGATWEDIGEKIGGVLGALYAFAMNNVIVPLQNTLANFGNFVGNFLRDPLGSTKILFLDMVTTALGYISKLAHGMEDLINKIPGMQVNLTSGIDWIYNNVKGAAQQAKDSIGWVEYFKPLDYVDYGDTISSWAEKGASIGKALDDFDPSDLLSNIGGTPFDPSELLGNIPDTLGDISADTSAIKKSVALSEEDMKLLVDMAERQYINNINLTAQTPVINITGQNTGNTAQDEQWLAETLKKMLMEQAASHTDLRYQ